MLATNGRVALYGAPRPGDPLWSFGSRAIGYDAASGAFVDARPPLALAAERWAELTADPRRYGFHATLKAPFRLAEGCDLALLSRAMGERCGAHLAPPPFRLEVRSLGVFLALVPSVQPQALTDLAAGIVTDFDRFRAPLSDAERERRLASKLSDRQLGYLERLGYPYVLDEFRFHMSLTGKVRDAVLREELREAFTDRLAREIGDPIIFHLDELVLFVQPEPDANFRIRERHALGMTRA